MILGCGGKHPVVKFLKGIFTAFDVTCKSTEVSMVGWRKVLQLASTLELALNKVRAGRFPKIDSKPGSPVQDEELIQYWSRYFD